MNEINRQQAGTVRQKLVEVALGKKAPDLIIKNGTLLNVFTGELIPETSIAIVDDRIAFVGNTGQCQIGDNTVVVDADGRYLVPGFIDSHYHIESSLLSPRRHAELTLPRGTTSIFEDTHEIANVLGVDGVKYFINEGKNSPQKIYVSVSSATPPTNFETTGAFIGYSDVQKLAEEPSVVGIGEIMDFASLFDFDPRLWGVIQAGLEHGMLIEGHSSTTPPLLDAYIAAGISSTHSPRNPEEAWEMLRRGAQLQLQMDRSEEIIRSLLKRHTPWNLVGLAIDDRPAHVLLEKGSIDYEIRKAIEYGVEVTTAYQMATINNALHWKMTHDIGSIAPGRLADIVVIEDLSRVTIDKVIANGRLLVDGGKAIAEICTVREVPIQVQNTVKLKEILKGEDFEVHCSTDKEYVESVVLVPQFFDEDYQRLIKRLDSRKGIVLRDLDQDICKVAIIERHKGTGNIGKCFWQIGFKKGAIAMSILHDSHNISVVGAVDEDMALAANKVAEIGGGIVVVNDGEIVAELKLEIGGLMTDAPVDEVASRMMAIEEEVRKLGPAPNLGEFPASALKYIFLTCFPRTYVLTDQGLFHVNSGREVKTVLAN